MQRFFQKIVGAGLDGGNRGLDTGMSAHHDDREQGESGMQTFQELHTVYAWEPDIQQDERGLHGVEALPEALRIRKYDGLIPLVLQDARYRGIDGRFVVYYANRVHIRLCLMFIPV
jgi:hypothetical protein